MVVARSLEGALSLFEDSEPPTLVLLDASLPALDPRMSLDRLLACLNSQTSEAAVAPSIVLISDTVISEWVDRIADNVIDDLIPRHAEPAYWRVRIEMVLRNRNKARELESFREAAALSLHTDRLTGVYNREAILAALFRETDRLQRMNGTLSLLLFDIDDFGRWNSRLGSEACDDLLCQVAGRIARFVRSYDVLGRPGMDEFLIVLAGCGTTNALLLAERIRLDVFARPFHVAGESVLLTACFGITSSQGRSPVVVLREAEQALQWARTAGSGAIECFASRSVQYEPMTFLAAMNEERHLGF